MLIIELMMYTSCVQGNAYCHCTLFHALILIVKLLLWKEIMLNNVAVASLLRVCCNIWIAKSTDSYALELITYIVSGLINKYVILTFIYKIVPSSKESRIHNIVYSIHAQILSLEKYCLVIQILSAIFISYFNIQQSSDVISVKFLIFYWIEIYLQKDLVFKTMIVKSVKTKLMDNLHHVTHFLQLRQQKYVSRNILDEEA